MPALYGFNRSDARTLRGVAASARLRNDRLQKIGYPTPSGLLNGQGIQKYRLTATLVPGGSAAATLMAWNATTEQYDDTTTSTTIYDNYDPTGGLFSPGVWDDGLVGGWDDSNTWGGSGGEPYGVNFGLSGEVFDTRWDPVTQRQVVIGSRGLRRYGEADSAITTGNQGLVSLLNNASGGCTGTDTTVDVTACAKIDVDANDKVFVAYHVEMQEWFITETDQDVVTGTATTLIRVLAKAFFQPGATGQTMDRYNWSAGTWVDSGEDVEVQNSNSDACLIQGEYGWAVLIDDSVAPDLYELVPVGTHRHAELVDDIDVGSEGTVRLISHSAATCAGVAQSNPEHQVEACNGHNSTHGHRKLFTGERVWVRWFEGKWLITNVERLALIGKPQSDFQKDSTGAFTVQGLAGGVFTPNVTQTINNVRNMGDANLLAGTDCYYEIVYPADFDTPIAVLVNQSKSSVYIGQLDANVTSGSTGTFSIYRSSVTDSTENLTVRNLTGQTLLSGVWCRAFRPMDWSAADEWLVEPYALEPC